MNRSDLIQQRLAALRDAMKRHKLDVYFVPTADPHNSEYIAEHWKTREWFSGFRGSAGTLVVSADKAALWTDSRYFLQAAEELSGTGIELMKDGLAETPDIVEWISTHCSISSENFTVGLDTPLAAQGSTAQIFQTSRRKMWISPPKFGKTARRCRNAPLFATLLNGQARQRARK